MPYMTNDTYQHSQARNTPSWWSDPSFRSGVSSNEYLAPILAQDPTTMSDNDYLKAKQAYEKWGRSERADRSIDEYSQLMKKYGMEPSKSRIGQIISGVVPSAQKQQSTGRTWEVENIGKKADAAKQAARGVAAPQAGNAPVAGQKFPINREKETSRAKWNNPELYSLWATGLQAEQKDAMLALDDLLPTLTDSVVIKYMKTHAKDIRDGNMTINQALTNAQAGLSRREAERGRTKEDAIIARKIQLTKNDVQKVKSWIARDDLNAAKLEQAWKIAEMRDEIAWANYRLEDKYKVATLEMRRQALTLGVEAKEADVERKEAKTVGELKYSADFMYAEFETAKETGTLFEQRQALRDMVKSIREFNTQDRTYIAPDNTRITVKMIYQLIKGISTEIEENAKKKKN